MHVEAAYNGLGAQSMLMELMACRREIPATVSFVADTGWELDRLWSNGRRSTAKEYFDEIMVPLCQKYGHECHFVRSVDKNGVELPPLNEHLRQVAESGDFKNLSIPMFGSRKGRVKQRCTDKKKIRACRQALRRMGAKTACGAQGIHYGEADRRVSGIFLREENGWSIYQTVTEFYEKQPDGTRIKKVKPIKWLTHYYPLVDLGLNRNDCQRRIVAEGIPYLISSECDGCPHKDLPRWERTSPHVLADLAKTEAMFNGEFFFTDKRIPLLEAIEAMRAERAANPEKYDREADFGCQNAICGI